MADRTRTWWMFATAILASPFFLVVALNAAGDINNPASIEDFIGCLDQRLQGTKPDISNAVQCLPKGCKFLLTMSECSAQKACSLGTCQLPRVIFDCPGPKDKDGKDQGLRFRPSFLMCPRDSKPKDEDVARGADDEYGFNRIEAGEDKERVDVPGETGHMRMADIPIPPGADYMMRAPDDLLSNMTKVDGKLSNRGTKACNACHEGPDATEDGIKKKEPQLSKPSNPYSKSCPNDQTDLRPYVIFDYPDNSKLMPDGKKLDKDGKRIKVGDREVTNQGLDQICDCISKNSAAIQTAARELSEDDLKREVDGKGPREGDPGFKIETLTNLCAALKNYADTKACGKAAGTTCANAAGGGKFLDSKKNVSILRFDMTGDATLAANNSLSFLDRDGTLTAYNYLTRKNVDKVAFNSLDVTLSNGKVVNGLWMGDIQVMGLGTGRVSGTTGSTNLWFQLDKKGGTLTYELRNGDSGALLAGGTGEAGRSDFAVKPRVP